MPLADSPALGMNGLKSQNRLEGADVQPGVFVRLSGLEKLSCKATEPQEAFYAKEIFHDWLLETATHTRETGE